MNRDSRFDATLQPGNANHEKFVEVVGKDCEEVHAFEHRNGLVLRELEYTPVECEPRQFAVEKSIRGERCVVCGKGFVPIVVEFGVGGPRGGVRLAHSSSPVGANR